MCGLFGTTAGLAFFLICPLVMIGMMAMAFLVWARRMRGRGGHMMCRLGSPEAGRDEERPLGK